MSKYRMPERVTPHIRRLIASGSSVIERQYRQPPIMDATARSFDTVDPLGEDDRFSKGAGIVHKFDNRALWKVTFRCAAHCQFCTRYRQIGSSAGDLSNDDITAGLDYIGKNEKIDDVILSGGDPLYVPHITERILLGLHALASVRVIRIGTRLPIHSPQSFRTTPIIKLFALLREIGRTKPIYVLVHVNHADELTQEVDSALRQLLEVGVVMLSQTVFLKGINDNVDTLATLFRQLFYRKVVPYYIYRCDYVQGLEGFVCDLELERQVMTQLTIKLSGIAVPTYVADVSGRGKIPVPLNFWTDQLPRSCSDFDGRSTAL